MTHKPDLQLFLSDARGVYIPRDFAQSIKRECVEGVSAEDWATLEQGPEAEWYWETWNDVLDHAIVTEPGTGHRFTVYQDGDCWLVPEGMAWDEGADFFAWPADEDEAEHSESYQNAQQCRCGKCPDCA